MAVRESGGERRSQGGEGSALALDFLFCPRAVAVVGASPARERNWGSGSQFLDAIRQMGFPGGLYPVNPNYQEVLGLRCYPSLRDLPEPVDYVIASVPAPIVPQVVEDCIAVGVRAVHLFTAGFSETGEAQRVELEEQALDRARQAGIRVLGPNCMGIYCPRSGLAFMTEFPREPGPVAFISQSGGHAGDMVHAAAARGIRFSKVVSYGNAADINECELLEYLAQDAETEVIAAYVEGVRDGRRFFKALKAAAARKPTIVFKGGRTDAGGRAVASHTGSLAGAFRVFEALCRQAGAISADSLEEVVDLAVGFRFLGPPPGPGVAVVAAGGGVSVFAADVIQAAGLSLPELPPEVQAQMRQFTPLAGSSVRNPIDSLVLWDRERLYDTLRLAASPPTVDVVLYFSNLAWRPGREMAMTVGDIVEAMARARETSGKPIALVLRHPLLPSLVAETLELRELAWRAGFPVFFGIPDAANTLAKMLAWQRQRRA